MLCAVMVNVGYVVASGRRPFWFYTPALAEDGKIGIVELIRNWFFSVPSGWLLLWGTLPFLVMTVHGSGAAFLKALRTHAGWKKATSAGAKVFDAAAGILWLVWMFFIY